MGEWRPIESAPKDGTPILVGRVGSRFVQKAWWNTDPQVWERDIAACWSVFTPEDYYYSVHLLDDDEPTHWQPLPTPPD